jgi:glycosyltransferase involved in cell wall biosynthesis
MAALEAMACGLPWVGPPVGALADVASRGKDRPSGILFQTRHPGEVASAMRSMIALSPAARCDYGRTARNVIEDNYDLVRQTEGLLQLIAQLTAQLTET